jgi:hypothetical protein
MAATLKSKYGTTSSPAVTGTPGQLIIGPPAHGGQAQGIYHCESGRGSTGTYAWLYDQPIDASATVPSTYKAHSI